MALTESKLKDLKDKKFDDLYAAHQEQWDDMAWSAHEYAKENVTGGDDPRPDDVAKLLFPTIQVNDNFREHQEDEKARRKYWIEAFVDYVIDRAIVNAPPEGED